MTSSLEEPRMTDATLSLTDLYHAAERLEGVHTYPVEQLAQCLRGSVVDVLICEAEPHVIADAIGIAVQAAAALDHLLREQGK